MPIVSYGPRAKMMCEERKNAMLKCIEN